MAYDDNQNESPLPADGKVKKISTDFLPKFFRTEANRKFLQGTLDQLITPGVAILLKRLLQLTITLVILVMIELTIN